MKKLTEKQRKALWLVVAVLVASYLFKSAANYARMQAYRRQVYLAALEAQKKAQQATAGNTVGGEAPAPLAHLGGIWEGRFASGITICDLRLVLTEEAPGKYTGFSRFSCMGRNPFESGANLRNGTLNLNPDTAILSGAMEKRSIRFHVDQTMGADTQGCAVTSLVTTYLGTASEISVQWEKGTCGGGHTALQRQQS